jgi:hypothetical protein
MAAQEMTDRARSAPVRPARTAERAIGRERNRSSRPLSRPPTIPAAVVNAPRTIIWVKIRAVLLWAAGVAAG